VPGDAETLAAAVEAVRALNERHRSARSKGDGAPAGDRFFLLHRERRWNPVQGVWMGWERKRGKLEEFNDLLRRSRCLDLLRHRRGRLPRGRQRRRRPLRAHARRRHADGPRRRPRARGDGGPPAQPAPLFRRGRPRRRGVRRVSAPRLGLARERSQDVLRPDVRRPARGRPVHDGRLGRLHGPVRGGNLHGQGALRCRRVPAHARGLPPRERRPLTRPPGGEPRPRRARDGRRGVRRLSAALRLVLGSAPPLDSRGLAASAVAPAPRPRRERDLAEKPALRRRPMEAVRQPPTIGHTPGAPRLPHPGVDGPPGVPVRVDTRGTFRARVPGLCPGRQRLHLPAAGHGHEELAFPRLVGREAPRPSVRAVGRVPSPSIHRLARRDREDAVAAARVPQEHAGVDDGSAGGGISSRRPPLHVALDGVGRGRPIRGYGRGADRVVGCPPVRGRLDRSAVDRPARQPAHRPRAVRDHGGRSGPAPARRPADVAVLRRRPRPGRPVAPAGQPPAPAPPGPRPADVTD
jgi:hypothetical protein